MTYLDRILNAHRQAAAADERPLDVLIENARRAQPARGFSAAIARCEGLAVISEIKRRSPSRGDLRVDLDPASVAVDYASGGATCLSVLTDAEFFGGSQVDLAAAREAVSIPVLRKDFTVTPSDVCDARVMGADALLLIVAALDDDELAELHALGRDLGLDVLVETHDEDEVDRALAVGATLIGVNQRDLETFHVDTDRALRVGAAIPEGILKVAESGISGAADAERLYGAGYDAVLVGESLVTSSDRAESVRALRSVKRITDR